MDTNLLAYEACKEVPLERIPRQFYTQEFKEEAVNLDVAGGQTVTEVSRRLIVVAGVARTVTGEIAQAVQIDGIHEP